MERTLGNQVACSSTMKLTKKNFLNVLHLLINKHYFIHFIVIQIYLYYTS